MTFSYNASDLSTSTDAGRLNAVRLLVGDTNSSDPLVQDEEITFALAQASNNIYYAGSWAAQLDGALSSKYSDLTKKYNALSSKLRQEGQRFSGNALGITAGGVSKTAVESAYQESDRVQPYFIPNQFKNPPSDEDQYIEDY
jgi:hypothetical protein